MYTINPINQNFNNNTPYQEEAEKPYYEMNSPAPVCNAYAFTPNTVETNNKIITHDESDIDNKKKRIIFSIILLFAHIIDLILECVLKYINIFSLIDDICIYLLVFVFYLNIFLFNNKNKITRCLLVFLFIVVWMPGFLCKFYTIIDIIGLKKTHNYPIYAIILIVIGHIIIFVLRIISLMQAFGGIP